LDSGARLWDARGGQARAGNRITRNDVAEKTSKKNTEKGGDDVELGIGNAEGGRGNKKGLGSTGEGALGDGGLEAV